jgi:hypothetical protein
MLFVIKEIVKLQDILRIAVSVLIYIPQEFDFINGLIHVVFIIFYDLHANHLLTLNIQHLNGFGKCCRTQVLKNLVPACNDTIDHYWELFSFLEASSFSIVDNSQIEAVIDDIIIFDRVEFILLLGVFDCGRKMDVSFLLFLLALILFILEFLQKNGTILIIFERV